MTESKFQERPLPDGKPRFWGKHIYDNRREIVIMYRVDEYTPEYYGEKALVVEYTYYLDYEPPKRTVGFLTSGSTGRTAHLSEYHKIEGVFDLEYFAREHFEVEKEDMLATMKDIERCGKL